MNLIELNQALRQLRLGGIAAVLETRLRQAQVEPMAWHTDRPEDFKDATRFVVEDFDFGQPDSDSFAQLYRRNESDPKPGKKSGATTQRCTGKTGAAQRRTSQTGAIVKSELLVEVGAGIGRHARNGARRPLPCRCREAFGEIDLIHLRCQKSNSHTEETTYE